MVLRDAIVVHWIENFKSYTTGLLTLEGGEGGRVERANISRNSLWGCSCEVQLKWGYSGVKH